MSKMVVPSVAAAIHTVPTTKDCCIDDYFSDEILGEILSYCDFPSAVRWCHLVNKSRTERTNDQSSSHQECTLGHVWRLMYERHQFAPIEGDAISAVATTTTTTDYLSEIRRRRRLLFNLLQQKRQKCYNRCFNLPNRYFFFKPIIPQDLLMLGRGEEDDEDDDDEFLDQPPVFYECDSFVLSSPGTSGECIFLDPFDGRLSVIKDIVAHCVASDEAMMEQAMVKAADAISTVPRSRCFMDWKDDEIAGHCFEESVVLNHTRHEYPPPPCQELLKADESFYFDLAPYFPNREMTVQNMTDEYDLSYVGTDAKPILDPHSGCKSIQGYMVGVGRSMTNLSEGNVVCTELTLWSRRADEDQYDVDGSRMLCRFPWSFSIVDFEPLYRRLFVSFMEGEGPADSSKTIVVYPMISWTGEDKDYFPRPLGTIVCRHPVSSMSMDCTGEVLLVGCERTLEVWYTPHSSSSSHVTSSDFQRLQVVDVTQNLRTCILNFTNRVRDTRSKCVTKTQRKMGSESVPASTERITTIDSTATRSTWVDDDDESPPQTTPIHVEPAGYNNNNNGNISINNDRDDHDDSDDEEEEVLFRVLKRLPDLSHLRSPIDSILIPKHLPAKDGFVTLHYDRNEGSSLLLWRLTGRTLKNGEEDGTFTVASLINLRLSARRKPRVSYDGNRLIVFGEDHIGMIILIYQISNGDIQFHEDDTTTTTGEHSGGVYNLTTPPQVRFANRIRHVALSGIDRFDSIHLTANERFIIVNTKSGHLLGGTSCPFSEGLLVIDLEEATMVRPPKERISFVDFCCFCEGMPKESGDNCVPKNGFSL